MKLWCERAWLGGSHADAGVVIETDGERIGAVMPGAGVPPNDAKRLPGLTLPGLVNAHSHAFHRALRSRTQGERGSFWTWREQMYRLAATLTPDTYLPLAVAAYAEMALAGITTVGEFHYLHHAPGGVPYAEPNVMGEVLTEAAATAGIRLSLLDTCYLHGGIGREPDDVQRRFSDGAPEAWAIRGIGAAGFSSRAARRGDPLGASRGARGDDGGGRLGQHERFVSPCPRQRAAGGERRHPRRLWPHSYEPPRGRGDPRAALHRRARHPRDLRRCGPARRGRLLHLLLSDDRARPGRRRRPGRRPRCGRTRRVCLGSDSHAVVDLLEEARAGRARRPAGDRSTGTPLLEGAPRRGHQRGGRRAGLARDRSVGGRDDGGPPRRRHRRRTAGAGAGAEHVLDAAVFAGTASDVRHVMVAGRWVVHDGRHVALDVPGALASSVAAVWR